MDYYNYRRTHQGYKLKENGYKIPGQAHLLRDLTKIEGSDKLKIRGKIMNRKEGEKNLTFALSPVKVKSKNGGVLAREFVTTS